MNIQGMYAVLDRLLDEAKVAILSNVDLDGVPRMRWMSPARIRGRDNVLYALSSAEFSKSGQLEKRPAVSWLLQSRSLDEVLSIIGTAHVLRDPSLQQEAIEAIGPRLGPFWRLNPDSSKMVVIETSILKFEYFKPSLASKVILELGKDA